MISRRWLRKPLFFHGSPAVLLLWIKCLYMCGFISELSMLCHWSVYLSCINACSLNYCDLVIMPATQESKSFDFVFPCDNLVSLIFFHTYFRITLYISMKTKTCWDLIGITVFKSIWGGVISLQCWCFPSPCPTASLWGRFCCYPHWQIHPSLLHGAQECELSQWTTKEEGGHGLPHPEGTLYHW